jgi:hypothetical protein
MPTEGGPVEQAQAFHLASALEGPAYNLISLIVGILGLIGTTVQAVVAVQQRAERHSGRTRWSAWRSLKRGSAKVAMPEHTSGIFCVFASSGPYGSDGVAAAALTLD